jgi:hypothetical protein
MRKIICVSNKIAQSVVVAKIDGKKHIRINKTHQHTKHRYKTIIINSRQTDRPRAKNEEQKK